MKKLLCLVLLLGTSMAYACNCTPCMHLNIKIKNNTPYTCHLVNLHFKHATSEDWKNIPLVLHAGIESMPFNIMQDSNYSPKATLSYACGDGRSITIQSTQTPCRQYTKNTEGTIIASENMDATFDTNNASYFGGKPGEINWVLN
jgi:hypothetical protein